MTYSKEKKYKDFETLFRTNYSRLYFYAFNLVNDQECAEDIVADTFSYLWKTMTPYFFVNCSARCKCPPLLQYMQQ